ncbi:PREDICTED: ufm1-specific protease 2-like [Priapulus caudatus]|uniref:Ufm1-specific protease 2-like n=1 Tax=Priapulus caudatus TaxID=37621 RepID=A0ABM1E2P5_PRICU|nr:PREDICTED: ufm1-specific protease 2-like [Priapulus caudatus]
MAAPMMKFVLHDSVPKALESCVGPESYGYLCGIWNREKWIVIGALSCRVQKLSSLVSQLKETLVLLPGGVGICGVYYGSQETITEEHVKQFAFKNLTAEFQEISGCESPCIVAVHLVAGVKPSNIYQYDIRNTVISQPACCISDVPSDKVVLRVQGKLRLSFDLSGNICETLASIRSAVSDLKQLVSSNVSAFHVRQSNVLLQKDASSSLMFVSDLWASLQTDDARAMEAKKKTVQKRAVVDVGLLLQTTGDNAVGRTLTCIPVIQLEMKAFTTVIHQLSIDAVAIVMESDPAAKMTVVLCQAVCRQLDAIDLSFRKFHKCVQSSLMRPHHFNPDMLEHLVTTIYPDSMDDAALESYRKELHERLHLPDDRPLLKKAECTF